jgi:hypothetical protein
LHRTYGWPSRMVGLTVDGGSIFERHTLVPRVVFNGSTFSNATRWSHGLCSMV